MAHFREAIQTHEIHSYLYNATATTAIKVVDDVVRSTLADWSAPEKKKQLCLLINSFYVYYLCMAWLNICSDGRIKTELVRIHLVWFCFLLSFFSCFMNNIL